MPVICTNRCQLWLLPRESLVVSLNRRSPFIDWTSVIRQLTTRLAGDTLPECKGDAGDRPVRAAVSINEPRSSAAAKVPESERRFGDHSPADFHVDG